MTSPSKAKGNSFERLVADFLSNLYGETFIRVPGSGAYVGGKNVHRNRFFMKGKYATSKETLYLVQVFRGSTQNVNHTKIFHSINSLQAT